MTRPIEEVQQEVAERLAEREAAAEAKREHQQAVIEALQAIRTDDSLSSEVRNFKEGCLSAHLDAGGDLAQFEKLWPELRLRWITEKAAGAGGAKAAIPPF